LTPLFAFQRNIAGNIILINHPGYAVDSLHNGLIIAYNTPLKINHVLNNTLISFGNGIIVNGKVVKNIVSLKTNVRLNKTAEVEGNVLTVGGVIKAELGAKARGLTISIFKTKLQFSLGFKIFLIYISFITLGLFFNFFFLKNFIYIGEYLKQRFINSFVYGISIIPLSALLAFVLMGTIVGYLFLPALTFIYTFYFFFALYATATVVGEKVVKLFTFKDHPYFEQFIGVSLLFFFFLIPFIGPAITAIILLGGLGGVIKLKFGVR
jgi:hypothetical protein